MCNHCQSHGLGEGSKKQVRQGFLKMLVDSSSQMSEMEAGILIKNFGGGRTEVGSFGSLNDILDMSSQTYPALLKVALDRAKAENDLELTFMLFDQVNDMAHALRGFTEELDKVTDEIKASMMGGIYDGRSTKG